MRSEAQAVAIESSECDAESDAPAMQKAAQTAVGTKRLERTNAAEVLVAETLRSNLSAPALSGIDAQMTLRRFELRFLP